MIDCVANPTLISPADTLYVRIGIINLRKEAP